MPKGPAYERWLCKKLSLWWTAGREDDVFWRTAGSGGRATARAARGRRTAAAAGDLCAVDARGAAFTRWVAVELKAGYNHAHLHDLLDRAPQAGSQTFEGWVGQARASARQAGAPHWLLVHSRDRRDTTVTFPDGLVRDLALRAAGLGPPVLRLAFPDRGAAPPGDGRAPLLEVWACRLDAFLEGVSPDEFREPPAGGPAGPPVPGPAPR